MQEYSRRLATLTPGFSGADIENISNEAAILAARDKKDSVGPKDLEMAVERIIGGLEKRRLQEESERKTVAVHECGHAVVSWYLKGGMPLLKLTIIPRSKGSLGFAQYLPNETSLETKTELVDQLCSILGGRVAEEIFFGKITNGAGDDLNKVNDLAHRIVTKFGMVANIGFVSYNEDQYGNKSYSNYTATLIDEEKKKLIKECTEITRELINTKRVKVEELSTKLLEKESLEFREIYKILGPKPFGERSSFKAFFDEVADELKLDSEDNQDAKVETDQLEQSPAI